MAAAALPRQKRDSAASSKILLKGTGGMRMVRADGLQSFFELKEPVWESDKHMVACNTCGDKFSFIIRKHHCRRSGIVLCDRCCIKIPLERFAYMDPVRVCAWWREQCEYENEFFQKNLPVLRNSKVFTVEHNAEKYPDIAVELSDDDSMLTFTAEDGTPWDVVPELAVQTIHMTDDKSEKKLTLTTKKTGPIVLLTDDKEVMKKWRKSIKKMIKVLHGKAKKEIPKEFGHMREMLSPV